jgi:uncharacterized damage-inducible protein DinB
VSDVGHFQQLFKYDDWANRQVISALEAISGPPQHSMKALAHILSAEKLWWERLAMKPQTYPVWPEFALAQCKTETEELPELWKQYLASQTDGALAQEVRYKNSKGESFANRATDILQHVILHSMHHRGQIVADLRAAGHTPPYLDFIHAVRQNQLP